MLQWTLTRLIGVGCTDTVNFLWRWSLRALLTNVVQKKSLLHSTGTFDRGIGVLPPLLICRP